MPNQRQLLTTNDLDSAQVELIAKLTFRAKQKGMGGMSSNHEILGIISQELDEYQDAIHKRISDEEKVQELLDIAVAALWGIASIRSGAIDW